MKYYIQRQEHEYGPYTLADLQRYIAQGNIVLADLTRSEGMTEWVPVSQVIGNIPIPLAAPPVQVPYNTPAYGSAAGYGAAPAYATAGTVYSEPIAVSVVPPDLHWALVLLLSVLTFTLFGWAWLIVQAAYVRRIDNESKGVLLAVFSLTCAFLGWFTTALSRTWDGEPTPWAGVFLFVGFILLLGAIFQIRSDLEDYYNVVEPINLQVNGVLTFFCGILYLQYHFSRIAQWKKTGVLTAQGS
jgi:uncharacterized protein DUF4339